MTKLIALCYFALSLYGCDVGGSTYVDRSDALLSRVVVQAGIARFECLRSRSGRCFYTVFAPGCASSRAATASAPARVERCPRDPIARFAVTAGDSRHIPALQRLRPCVSARDAAPAPDCDMQEPVATR